MSLYQPGILDGETHLARYMTFSINDSAEVKQTLKNLAGNIDLHCNVLGIGESLAKLLEKNISGLRNFSAQTGPGVSIPSTPAALWIWLRGNDRGELFHRSRQMEKILQPGFQLTDTTDAFQYDGNRDLSGYEDGTENPEGDEAIAAAIVQNTGTSLDGSSFVAVQKWQHNFEALNSMTTKERDDIIGRHIADNEEFDEAPESAHVKRSAQESFEPEAFILRRSMPWAEGINGGLMFVAFGKTFDAFEAILNRMLGQEDGITDALFQFTIAETSAYYWCPPIKDDKLDLSLLGL